MFVFLRSVGPRNASRKTRMNRNSTNLRPGLEALEGRVVLDAAGQEAHACRRALGSHRGEGEGAGNDQQSAEDHDLGEAARVRSDLPELHEQTR